MALIGGRAEDRTTAPSPGGLTSGSRAEVAGFAVVAVPAAERAKENSGSPASEAGGGIKVGPVKGGQRMRERKKVLMRCVH